MNNGYFKRIGHSFNIEDEESAITILKPFSGEISHNGSYIIIYEDVHGMVETNFMKISEISSFYGIEEKELTDKITKIIDTE